MNFSAMIGISYRNLSQDWCIHGVLFKKSLWFSQNSVAIKKSIKFQLISAIRNEIQKNDNVFRTDFFCVP